MFKNVYSRGVGGQNSAKFGLRSFWTNPDLGLIFFLSLGNRRAICGSRSDFCNETSAIVSMKAGSCFSIVLKSKDLI